MKDEIIDLYNNKFLPLIGQNEIKANIANELEKINISENIKTPGALKVFEDSKKESSAILSSENIIKLTNTERSNNGNLPALVENDKLNFSAQKKVQDMFTRQYFEHNSPDGIGVADLGNQVAYEYIIIGENLAMGNFADEESIVKAWMDSPGHRANILNEDYSEIGVFVSEGIFNGQKVWLAVQHFALPREACPPINEVLRQEIEFNGQLIKEYEQDLSLRLENIEKKVIYEGLTTNEQIKVYNTKIISYNELVSETKQKTDEYNKQVNDFNTCLSENLE